MKTLIISSQNSDISIGGIERYLKNLVNYCQQKDKEVIFLLPTQGEETTEKKGNVVIYKKNFLSMSYRRVGNKKQISEKDIREKSKLFFSFLNTLFDENTIDVVDAENFYLGLPAAFSLVLNMVCFSRNIPIILRAHSFTTNDIQKALVNNLFWEKVVCVSKSVAGDFFNKGMSIQKLDTHYLGVDTLEFKPEKNYHPILADLGIRSHTKLILHASRLTDGKKDILKEKGITTLLDAFSQLAPKNQDLTLLIAMARAPKQSHPEFVTALDKLHGYIQLNNLKGRVICKEFELEDMPRVYNRADMFVMASENETFGQVYIEAMACGIPVIGTNVGGVPEVITDNYNGFLIEPNNPSLLMQKIEKILYEENTRKEFISNGLKTVRRKFSTDRQFSQLFNKFEKIASLAKLSQLTHEE